MNTNCLRIVNKLNEKKCVVFWKWKRKVYDHLNVSEIQEVEQYSKKTYIKHRRHTRKE